MSNTQYPKARTENLVVQFLPGETLVYDVTSNEAHCLNETAGFIWSMCSGEVSIDEITRSATAAFGKPVNADLVDFAVKELHSRKLLSESAVELPMLTNRREAIKRIGLTSAVAIPIIASLVAPRSAMSFTSCACASPAQCATPRCPTNTVCDANGECSPRP